MSQGPRSGQEAPVATASPPWLPWPRRGGGTQGQHTAQRWHRRGHGAARLNERCWHRPPAPPRQMASAWARFRETAGRSGGGTWCAGAAGAACSHVPLHRPPRLCPSALVSPKPRRPVALPEMHRVASGLSGVGGHRGHRGRRRGGTGVAPGTKAKGRIQGCGCQTTLLGGVGLGPPSLGADPARCCHGGARLSLPAPEHGGGHPVSGTLGT